MIFITVLACATTRKDAALVAQLDKEVLALHARNESLWEELRKCDTPDVPLPLYQELIQAFSGSAVTVTLDGLEVIVEIPGALLLTNPLDLKLSDSARMVTDLLATTLQSNPDPHVWIVGHTDGTPLTNSLVKRFGTEWELSAFQAALVAHAMMTAGVDPTRFTVSGRGSSAPLATGEAEEPRSSRRVVVVVGSEDAWR